MHIFSKYYIKSEKLNYMKTIGLQYGIFQVPVLEKKVHIPKPSKIVETKRFLLLHQHNKRSLTTSR